MDFEDNVVAAHDDLFEFVLIKRKSKLNGNTNWTVISNMKSKINLNLPNANGSFAGCV